MNEENAPQTTAVKLALVTIFGAVEDAAFTQGAWSGVIRYAEEHKLKCKAYQPDELSARGHLAAIDTAVKNGAEVIVTPGHRFAVPVYIAQNLYPNTKFILLGGTPHDEDRSDSVIGDNTISVDYAEEQAGFLAGYGVVRDGMTKLGFMGALPFPAIIRFGYGFIQGADYAAAEMSLGDSVTIEYRYTGEIDASDNLQDIATSLYKKGVQVIFGCGGSLCDSIMLAAEQCGRKVIGVDTDQSSKSPVFITSALKNLHDSVYEAVSACYSSDYQGGKYILYSAKNKGISLSISTSSFKTFSAIDYQTIYQKLADESIPITKDMVNGNNVSLSDLTIKCVKLLTET